MLNITKERKKDIQLFIKKNKLKLRKDRENTLVKIAAYYDQLNNR